MSYVDDINKKQMEFEAEMKRKAAEEADAAMRAGAMKDMPDLSALKEPTSQLSYQDLVDKFQNMPERAPAATPAPMPILEQAREVLKARQASSQAQPLPIEPPKAQPDQMPSSEDAELESAQNKDKILNLMSGLADAGQIVGQATSRGRYQRDPNLFKQSDLMTDRLIKGREVVKNKRDMDYQKKLMDPKSDTNIAFRKMLKDSKFDLPEEMTMADAIKSGMLPTLLAGKSREEIANLKLDMAKQMASTPRPMTEYQQARIEQGEKRLGASEIKSAATQYDKNLGKLSDSLGQGNRIFELIGNIKSGKLTGTPQELDTITQKMSQLIAAGGASAAADRAKLRYENLTSLAAKGKQFLSSDPKSGIPKSILQEIENESKIIYDELHKEAQNRVNALAEAETNPTKAEYYNKRFNKYVEGHGANKSSEAPKPKTVIQNGHTYTLNEKTGKYE